MKEIIALIFATTTLAAQGMHISQSVQPPPAHVQSINPIGAPVIPPVLVELPVRDEPPVRCGWDGNYYLLPVPTDPTCTRP